MIGVTNNCKPLALLVLVFLSYCSLPASADELSERHRRAVERMRQHHSSGSSFGRGNTFGSGLSSDDYHAPGATDSGGNPYLRQYQPPAPPPGVPASYLQPPPDQIQNYNPSMPAPNVGRAAAPSNKRNPTVSTPRKVKAKPPAMLPAPTTSYSSSSGSHAPKAKAAVASGYSKSPSKPIIPVADPPSKFDYSNSANLDAIKATNAELTVHGTKFDIKGNFDWNRVKDGALRGGAIGGLVGLVAWLAVFGMTKMMGASSGPRGPRPGMEPRGGNTSTATVAAAIIGVSTIGATTWMNGSKSDSSSDAIKLLPVHSNEFSCRVLMPSPYHKIYVKMIDPATLGSKPIYYTAVEFDRKDIGCVFGYAKLPPLPANTAFMTYYFDTNKALDGATKGSVERIGGIIKSQYPITLKNGRHPGREADGTLPKDKGGGLFRQRIYISGGHYYQVAVYGNPDWVNSNDAFKFLDSFDLIEAKQ